MTHNHDDDTVAITEPCLTHTLHYDVIEKVLSTMINYKQHKKKDKGKEKAKETEEIAESVPLMPLRGRPSFDDFLADDEPIPGKAAAENIYAKDSTKRDKGKKPMVSEKTRDGTIKRDKGKQSTVSAKIQEGNLSQNINEIDEDELEHFPERDEIPIPLRNKGKNPIRPQSREASTSKEPGNYLSDHESDEFDCDTMGLGLRGLSTGQQKLPCNVLFEANLPSANKSTLDRLYHTASEYMSRHWEPGFLTRPPGRRFATDAILKAEEEYMKTLKPRNYGKSWIQAAKDDAKLEGHTSWKHLLNPAAYRKHGKLLKEFEEPPERSCRIKAQTLCGRVEYLWYVKCHDEKPFFRKVRHWTFCGEGKCDENPDWVVGQAPFVHESSVKQWVQVDPRILKPPKRDPTPVDPDDYVSSDEEEDPAIRTANKFPFWMIAWLHEGPPNAPMFKKCVKATFITKCGQRLAKFMLFCDPHSPGEVHCAGTREYFLKLDKGCSGGEDRDRCEVKTCCDELIAYFRHHHQENPAISAAEKEQLGKLVDRLTSEYTKDTSNNRYYPQHSMPADWVGKYTGFVPDTLGSYEILSRYGLKSIDPPTDQG